MPLITVLIVLVVAGVILWAINTYGSSFIDGKFLKLINIVAIVVAVLWVLSLFVDLGSVNAIRVGR